MGRPLVATKGTSPVGVEFVTCDNKWCSIINHDLDTAVSIMPIKYLTSGGINSI